MLAAHRPAFQLGNIVADARVASGVGREVTHFYKYDVPMIEHPWRVMFNDHPTLNNPHDDAHRVFLAGYVTHLATDEAWALKMVRPHFWKADWSEVEPRDKFIALHLILTYMDERDELLLEPWQADMLPQCVPDNWLTFMPDSALCGWRDLVAEQISSNGVSQTVQIFSGRLGLESSLIRNMLDKPDEMQQRLWQHIPQSLLATVEQQIYAYTRDQLNVFLTEFL